MFDASLLTRTNISAEYPKLELFSLKKVDLSPLRWSKCTSKHPTHTQNFHHRANYLLLLVLVYQECSFTLTKNKNMHWLLYFQNLTYICKQPPICSVQNWKKRSAAVTKRAPKSCFYDCFYFFSMSKIGLILVKI